MPLTLTSPIPLPYPREQLLTTFWVIQLQFSALSARTATQPPPPEALSLLLQSYPTPLCSLKAVDTHVNRGRTSISYPIQLSNGDFFPFQVASKADQPSFPWHQLSRCINCVQYLKRLTLTEAQLSPVATFAWYCVSYLFEKLAILSHVSQSIQAILSARSYGQEFHG